jgi:hypothetical protein
VEPIEQRLAELEARVEKLEAARGPAAWIDGELALIEIRKQRIEKFIQCPERRQDLLTALEAQRCSLQSSLQQLE